MLLSNLINQQKIITFEMLISNITVPQSQLNEFD